MSPKKRKALNDEESFKYRRSSLRVNLSYMSDLSDSGHGSFKKNFMENDFEEATENDASVNKNVYKRTNEGDSEAPSSLNPGRFKNSLMYNNPTKTVKVVLTDIKEVRGEQICNKLKDAILNKTRELFDDENELLVKTTKVLVKSGAKQQSRPFCDKRIEFFRNNKNFNNGEGSFSCSGTMINTPKNTWNKQSRDSSEAVKNKSISLKKRLFSEENELRKLSTEENIEINTASTSKSDKSKTKPVIIEDKTFMNSPILSGYNRLRLSRLSQKHHELNIQRQSTSNAISDRLSPGSPIICSSFIEQRMPLTDKDTSNAEVIEIIESSVKDVNTFTNSVLRKSNISSGRLSLNSSNKSLSLKKNLIDKSEKPLSMELTTAQGNILVNSTINLDTPSKSENVKSYSIEDSVNTVRTSLNVNTSLDPILNEMQSKKNEKNGNIKNVDRESCCTVRSSLQVNTSLDSVSLSSKNIVEMDKPFENKVLSPDNQTLAQRLKNVTQKKVKSKMEGPFVVLYRENFPLKENKCSNVKNEKDNKEAKRPTQENSANKLELLLKTDKANKETEECEVIRVKHRYPSIYTKMMNSGATWNTVVIESPSSEESYNAINLTIIPESCQESNTDTAKKKREQDKTGNSKNQKNKKKRRLFPTRQDSGLLSLSPVSMRFSPSSQQSTPVKKYRKKGKNQKTPGAVKDKDVVSRETTLDSKDSSIESKKDDKTEQGTIKSVRANMKMGISTTQSNKNKDNKKRKKVTSKKIVVKKVANLDVLESLRENVFSGSSQDSSTMDRSSINDFHSKKIITNTSFKRSNKLIIVVTGFSKEDKSLAKSVVKTLGNAEIEANVTRRTTHVVSTGVRTVNLLRAIIRGCWLISMDWILKSLENNKWLDANSFEMAHFSKAVQENRKERQRFGNAYVPELFMACGFIYVENGTNPPTSVLKELIKTAGGQIIEDARRARIIVGSEGLRENWILDSITTGRIQSVKEYQRKKVKKLR